jgi:hypothetical protein
MSASKKRDAPFSRGLHALAFWCALKSFVLRHWRAGHLVLIVAKFQEFVKHYF